MSADPTLQFLASLDDPSLYEVKRGVPVFRAHRRWGQDEQGNPVLRYEVTDADLERIAERCNRLEIEVGVPGRTTLGHTKQDPDAAEPSQPAPVGWCRNWRVGPFGPKGIKALICDLYIRRDRLADCRDYPYRSAEYFPRRGEVSGVALLRRDPELDLGVVYYSRAEAPVYYLEGSSMADDLDPTKMPGTGTATDVDPEEAMVHKHVESYMAKSYPHMRAMHDRFASEKEGEHDEQTTGAGKPETPVPSMALPSGTNGAMPEDKGAGEAYRRAQERADYARLQREHHQTRAELAQMRAEMAQSKRERDLAEATTAVTQLADVEGILIPDRAREIERLSRLEPAAREERIEELRNNYQRDPAAGRLLPTVEPTRVARTGEFTRAHFDKANEYMSQNPGCSWDKAEQYAREQLSTRR